MPRGGRRKGGRGKDAAGDKKKERAVKRALRTERAAGAYLRPGDPDFKSFSNQLAVQGLRLQDVPGDGNCLFRALAAQLGERGVTHQSLRRDVVGYMRQNPREFEEFLAEDEDSYEAYLDQLATDGEFAGNDAIVAFSRAFSSNIVIHQLNSPRWEILAPPTATPTQRTLHIAYLNGEHYTVVCPISDVASHSSPLQPSSRPKPSLSTAKPVRSRSLEASGAAAGGGASGGVGDSCRGVTTAMGRGEEGATGRGEEGRGEEGATGRGEEGGGAAEVDMLVSVTGCQDCSLAERVLVETGHDMTVAIAELLQLMELGSGCSDSSSITIDNERSSPAVGHNGSCPQRKKGNDGSRKAIQNQSKGHLSNRERKAQAKAERKERRREEKGGQKSAGSAVKHDPLGSLAI